MDHCLHLNHHRRRHGTGEDLISVESLPLVDTRLMSQSELLSLSMCSVSSSCSPSASLAASAGGDDDLTPKIDRSVFNESAGSKKQTFLRLRLARHPSPPKPPSPLFRLGESSREENLQIVSLLRSLFSIDSFPGRKEEDEDIEGDGQEDSEGQRLFPVPIYFFNNVYPNLNLDSIQNVLVQMISGNQTGRRRGRPRKVRNPNDWAIDSKKSEQLEALDIANRDGVFAYSAGLGTTETPLVEKLNGNLGSEAENGLSGFSSGQNSNASTLQGKKKRGRPPKNKDSSVRLIMNRKIEDKEVLDLRNRDGETVDLLALADAEDPYGEELRRRTVGLQTKEELLGFLAQVRGEWVNARKKKKVVEASDFGDVLPRRWKLLLCIRKKAGNLWLACHRYISPTGQQFASCKEVSAYLLSLLEVQGSNQINTTPLDDNLLLHFGLIPAKSSICDSVKSIPLSDLSVLGTVGKQPQQSERPCTWMFEHVKGEEKDIADPVNRDGAVVGLVTRANLVNTDNAAVNLVNRDGNAVDLVGRLGTTVVDSVKRDDATMVDMVNRDSMVVDFLNRDNTVADLANGDSAMADLSALSNSEALYGENLRKMTQGMATTEELLQFWSS